VQVPYHELPAVLPTLVKKVELVRLWRQ